MSEVTRKIEPRHDVICNFLLYGRECDCGLDSLRAKLQAAELYASQVAHTLGVCNCADGQNCEPGPLDEVMRVIAGLHAKALRVDDLETLNTELIIKATFAECGRTDELRAKLKAAEEEVEQLSHGLNLALDKRERTVKKNGSLIQENQRLQAEVARLKERCEPNHVVVINGVGHYVSTTIKDRIAELEEREWGLSEKADSRLNRIAELEADHDWALARIAGLKEGMKEAIRTATEDALRWACDQHHLEMRADFIKRGLKDLLGEGE